MEGPADWLRLELGAQSRQGADEDQLERQLLLIEEALNADIRAGSDLRQGQLEEADNDLAALYSWASVVSDVVVSCYGPTSPFHHTAAGWAVRTTKRIQRIANKIAAVLRNIVSVVGAAGFSISVGAPWPTLAIALNW